MNKKKILQVIRIMICLLAVGFSGWKLYGIYSEYTRGTETYLALADLYTSKVEVNKSEATELAGHAVKQENMTSEIENEDCIAVDFHALKEVCKDVVAWLYCPDTQINYPVVQGEDNEYYLHRLISGEYNIGGTLFMDFRNSPDFSDWNSIIYGHNMKNGSMFAILPDYMEQEFYEEHPVWYLLTEECTYQIKLAGGYVTPADSDSYVIADSAEERSTLANKAARLSSFRSNVDILENDRLITLSTCVYDYENARYVLVGVLKAIETAQGE